MIYLVVFLAFTAGFLFIFAINLLLLNLMGDRNAQIRKRLEAELQSQQRDKAKGSMTKKELFELAAEGYEDLTAPTTFIDKIRIAIEQSGSDVKPAQLIFMTIVFALAPALTIGFAWSWWVGGFLGVVGGVLPGMFISFKRARRREKLLSQLPDAFELMSRVLRAGQTVSQAMQSVASEFPRPIAEEFAYCWEQQNLGLTPEAAMRELARRTGLLELKIFVVAMMIHRTTGGNFADLLDKLARVIRDRYRIRGQIQALTAEGRFQAIILLVLPPALMCVLFVLNPGYIKLLFQHSQLLVGMLIFEAIGGLWMRKIINFDF